MTYIGRQFGMFMIIYSVTVSIDAAIEEEWADWMKKTHIPEVMNTGKFISCRFSKLISHREEGAVSYSAQYTCHSAKELEEYKEQFSQMLQQKSLEKFTDKMHAFRTELEVIQDYYSVLS